VEQAGGETPLAGSTRCWSFRAGETSAALGRRNMALLNLREDFCADWALRKHLPCVCVTHFKVTRRAARERQPGTAAPSDTLRRALSGTSMRFRCRWLTTCGWQRLEQASEQADGYLFWLFERRRHTLSRPGRLPMSPTLPQGLRKHFRADEAPRYPNALLMLLGHLSGLRARRRHR